ncbi:Hypothetical predicted protein, partial [Paramuricea clavata]
FHAPQTERMKHEIMKQLTGKNEDRVVRVVFATIAIGIGVNIHDIMYQGPSKSTTKKLAELDEMASLQMPHYILMVMALQQTNPA